MTKYALLSYDGKVKDIMSERAYEWLRNLYSRRHDARGLWIVKNLVKPVSEEEATRLGEELSEGLASEVEQ